jgi:hypothetical protein
MTTPLSTGIPRALTIDPAFDVDNHTPFAPLAATTSLQESVRVDGWETEGLRNSYKNWQSTAVLQHKSNPNTYVKPSINSV